MAYQIREEEKEKWSKEVWTTKARGEQKVSEIPVSYAKNIVKSIKRRYNKMYFETYINNSPLWLALNRRAGTDPLAQDTETQANIPQQSTMRSVSEAPINRSADKQLLLQLLNDEVTGIDSGDITLKDARDFIASLQIKLQQIL